VPANTSEPLSPAPTPADRDTLEQGTHAESLGFESIWPVEHHFNSAASILPCPALFLAAVAARTTRIRLGTAIVQVALAHPMRVAEELATLDVLSGGRLDFGVGRGGNPSHFAGFGVPMSESRDRMVEALDYIRRAWTTERFSFHGHFFRADDLALAPRPIQQPHPPIRIAANSPETAAWPGREGYPVLFASNVNPLPKLRELIPVYRRARAEAGHGSSGDGDLTLLMPVYVGDDRRRVEREVAPSVRQFAETAAAVFQRLVATAPEEERPKLQAIVDQLCTMTYHSVNAVTGIFDTPTACVERLQQIREEFNPGRVICWFNFGGVIPHHEVMRSMELFSARVLPQLLA
jgi:alkanesulfonate monooxygenase SsuD/methylene tetrahydromethanopterin reductase-like flavin-dependent oxidoreductase (luciferase family)